MKRAWRTLALLATSTLVVCGVKAPPRPPPADAPGTDAGAVTPDDAGAPSPGDGGQPGDGGAP